MQEKINDYTAFIRCWTDGFTGRKWLIDKVDAFLQSRSRILIIRGEAGIGKTAFAAHIVSARHPLHYFISAQEIDWASPSVMIHSLGAQITQKYRAIFMDEIDAPEGVEANPELANPDISDAPLYSPNLIASPIEEEFVRRVILPLNELAKRGVTPLFIIDGIDEAGIYHGYPPIPELLFSGGPSLPCKLILTIGNGMGLDLIERNFDEGEIDSIEISGEMQENLNDCRDYIESNMGALGRLVDEPATSPKDGLIAGVCARAEGNFLYLRMLLEGDLVNGDQLSQFEDLPLGLDQNYYTQFSRLIKNSVDKWFDSYAPILGVLSVARSSLSFEQLESMTQVPGQRLKISLDELSQFLYYDGKLALKDRKYRLRHTSIKNFLLLSNQSAEFSLQERDYHRLVADHLHQQAQDLVDLRDVYAFKNLSYHYRMAGRESYPQLFAMIDPDIRQARRVQFGDDQVFRQDIAEAVLAALDLGPAEGIVELVRCGLIDAGIVSRVANVSTDVLRGLAFHGEWERAISLAYTGTGRTAEGLNAVIEGLLDSHLENRIEYSMRVASQIDGFGEDAVYAAHSYAHIARALTENGDDLAGDWYRSGLEFIDRIPEREERARMLSIIGGYLSAVDRDGAWRIFDRAVAVARGIGVREGIHTTEAASDISGLLQPEDEHEWINPELPFDTLSAKAKVFADIAANMALGGEVRAEAVMAEAEDLAARIGGGGIEGLYARNTKDYLKERKEVVLTGKPVVERVAYVPLDELDKQIRMSEVLPRDQKGYFPRALIAIARELIAVDWKHAGEIMTRAEQYADHAESGYRAQLLLELARIRRQMGHIQAGEVLEQRAVQASMRKPELLAGHSGWLAVQGQRIAQDLRQGRGRGGGQQIGDEEVYTDAALNNLALSLAKTSTQDALLLGEQIRDREWRYRTLCGIAAQMSGNRAAQIVDDIYAECVINQDDDILLDASQALLKNHPDLSRKLAASISDPAKQILAILALVEDEPDGVKKRYLESAWQLSCRSDQQTGTMATALLRLGTRLQAMGDSRARACFQRAVSACRNEEELDQRANILCELASTIGEYDPERGGSLLQECIELGRNLGGIRARGKVLAKAAGVAIKLDADLACNLLAEIRFLGRANYLDAIAHIVHPIVERYGSFIAWKLYETLLEADQFS